MRTCAKTALQFTNATAQSKIFILSKSDMTATLKRYVDEENFPKKYGGKLEWKFGDMPNLEPAIADAMTWKEDIRQNGNRTFPTGPIRWEYNEYGDMEATAIGSENGKPRRRVIAQLKAQSGVTRLALSAGRIHSQQLAGGSAPTTRTATPVTSAEKEPPVTKEIEKTATPVEKEPPVMQEVEKTATPAGKEPPVFKEGEKTVSPLDPRNADLNAGKDPRASLVDESQAG